MPLNELDRLCFFRELTFSRRACRISRSQCIDPCWASLFRSASREQSAARHDLRAPASVRDRVRGLAMSAEKLVR